MTVWNDLEAFRKFKRGWDSYGAEPIDHHCIDKAKALLIKLGTDWQPIPMVCGGVALEFHKDGFDIEIEIMRSAVPQSGDDNG